MARLLQLRVCQVGSGRRAGVMTQYGNGSAAAGETYPD
jgi:hypothetical protein